MERTIQLSKGQGKASLRHNNRDFISPNVDRERIKDNIIIKQEDLGTAYEKIFGKAQAEYNAKQRRADRKIDNYFEKLFGKKPCSEILTNSNKTKSYYEFVAGVGDMHDTGYDTNPQAAKTAEQCLLDYINGNPELGIKSFEERNPNLYIFNAIIHADEKTPHLHFDFIPYADGYKKGMTRQQGYDKAIQQMGYKNFDDFIHSERAILRQISGSHGFEIAEEKESQRVTLPKQAFIEMNQSQRKNEELKAENKELKQENEELKTENKNLETENEEKKERNKDLDKEIAEKEKQLSTVQRELVAAIEIPPRPTIPPPPEEPKQPLYTYQHKEYKQQLKQYEKELKVYQSKTLPQATAAQAEWDEKYNLLQKVQNVQQQQQRTAEQQSQRAAIQEEKTEKLKKDRAELEQEERTLPQKAQAMALEMLRKMERFTELTKINAAWKQRYEQIFGKQYEERIDNNDRKTSQTEQNIRYGSKSQQPERNG